MNYKSQSYKVKLFILVNAIASIILLLSCESNPTNIGNNTTLVITEMKQSDDDDVKVKYKAQEIYLNQNWGHSLGERLDFSFTFFADTGAFKLHDTIIFCKHSAR